MCKNFTKLFCTIFFLFCEKLRNIFTITAIVHKDMTPLNMSYHICFQVSLIQLLNVRSQQLNDANFVPETDFDYTDFQQVQRTPIKSTLIKGTKPRSPVIAAASQQNKVTPVPILKQINRYVALPTWMNYKLRTKMLQEN